MNIAKNFFTKFAYQIFLLIFGFLLILVVGSYLFLRYHIERSQFVVKREVQSQIEEHVPDIKSFDFDFFRKQTEKID